MVDGDVGAEAADHFCPVQSECLGLVSYSSWLMTMVAERVGSLSIPSPFTPLKAPLNLSSAVCPDACREADDLVGGTDWNSGGGYRERVRKVAETRVAGCR